MFGDIMVLASPPRPPVDPDDVNTLTRQIFNLTLLLKFDTLQWLEQLRSQPNDTQIPQIFKMQYLHK